MSVPDRDRTPKFTAAQGQYLAFIYAYATIHRQAPAEADLRRFFRVTAPSVHRMVIELEQRGLRVHFLAHVNSLPSLWAELAKPRSDADLPVKGIQCRPTDDPRSVWVARYLKLERAWLLGAGRGLPFGHTLIAIAQKA